MAKEFPLVSIRVRPVATRYRRLRGTIPSAATIRAIRALRRAEPRSMQGQVPLIWDRAEGVNVFDADGNRWLDFSSGVLITNAGHGHPKVAEAIVRQARKPLLTTYCFPNEPRIRLARTLAALAPAPLKKVFLLSTGAEGIECALKLMRTWGHKQGGRRRNVVVSFDRAFHGRTLGAQQLGGIPAGKAWIVNRDPEIVQVPFPDGFRCPNTGFGLFEATLARLRIGPERVAGVISETYQGGGASFMPRPYARALRRWCTRHGALLCFDEVQSGFGRCGRLWGFELYGVVPDLFCLGKGLSSSLPVSAVIGRPDVMDLYGPNEMTSTHSGNPVCAAAALANIEAILKEGLVEHAARAGAVLHRELGKIRKEFPDVIGACHGAGLVAGLQMVRPGGKEPDGDLAWDVVHACYRKGLLMFAPVGFGGATVKIAPPLCIPVDAVREGCAVIREAIRESV
jgi:4-aminobutyrate aminotransferase/diaminobutyrate-pyruvate transaminase/4-aminobutyrate aminotransferase/(S)-3-amino-2-methylpropionate transaminase